jgi:protein TonB
MAIVRALAACRWRPGADARGQPIALWVILPIRFGG